MSEKLASIKKVGGGGTPNITLAGVYTQYNNGTSSLKLDDDCYYQVNASCRYSDNSYVRQSCMIVDPSKTLTLLYGYNQSAGGASWSYVYVSNGYLYMRGTNSSLRTDFIVTKISY